MVQGMNKKAALLDDYTLFRLLSELEHDVAGSQRELARRLDAALGLVNHYLKVAVSKGWVRVKEVSANRCRYHLTDKGEAQRTKLALQHARYFAQVIPLLFDEYRQLGRVLVQEGIERVTLCGIDTSAHLAWLALHEAGIEVTQLMDNSAVGTRFMGKEVVSLAHAMLSGVRQVVIGSHSRAAELQQALVTLGVEPATIRLPTFLGE